MAKPLILLTNDDGINSAGLWAAAATLNEIGEVLIVAPHTQYSAAGRSMPMTTTGVIHPVERRVNGHVWQGFGVDGSPAQAVQHGIIELAQRTISLVVSGINYGENIGLGVTVSGTIGAAIEGAAFGIPSLAVSLQTPVEHHHSLDESLDFSGAAHFTREFAGRLLNAQLPPDVHVLKLEIPADATPDTGWEITRLTHRRYFELIKPEREKLSDDGRIHYRVRNGDEFEKGSDAHALGNALVAVTPLSMDLTSRVDFDALRAALD